MIVQDKAKPKEMPLKEDEKSVSRLLSNNATKAGWPVTANNQQTHRKVETRQKNIMFALVSVDSILSGIILVPTAAMSDNGMSTGTA